MAHLYYLSYTYCILNKILKQQNILFSFVSTEKGKLVSVHRGLERTYISTMAIGSLSLFPGGGKKTKVILAKCE